jgi:antitoxin component YwqK of YwqJK toxin-antitoxin module
VSILLVVATISLAAPAAHAGPPVGGRVSTGPDPILHSTATGAMIGAAGGPIGMAVGAGIGLLHGLWAKRKQEEYARAEAERQRAADRELEREIAAQRPGGGAIPEGDGQGVLIVKDHLAESPSASPPTQVATTRDQVDADGFRSVFDGDRVVRREHRTTDGKVDVVLHYDAQGRIVRRDESTRLDGRLDTSSFYADGVLQRKEADTNGDNQPDVWAFYDAQGELARMESLVAGGVRRTETYRGGRVAERLEGDLLSVFDDAGRLVKQGRRGAADRMLTWSYFDDNGDVAREEEFGNDGRLTAVTHYEAGRIVRRELYEIDASAFTRVPVVSTTDPAGG